MNYWVWLVAFELTLQTRSSKAAHYGPDGLPSPSAGGLFDGFTGSSSSTGDAVVLIDGVPLSRESNRPGAFNQPELFTSTGDISGQTSGALPGSFDGLFPGQNTDTSTGFFTGTAPVPGGQRFGSSTFFTGAGFNSDQSPFNFPLPSFRDVPRPASFSSDRLGTGFRIPVGQNGLFLQDDTTSFGKTVIHGQITPTVTQTITNDIFTTLTDVILNHVDVTQTQFIIRTVTSPTKQVVPTPVDDSMTITTTVVHRPQTVTVTETKSDFRVTVRTSVNYITLTHTSYAITHVPLTITATEVVTLTSPIVRTIINTRTSTVTQLRTVANTVYVHGGYL